MSSIDSILAAGAAPPALAPAKPLETALARFEATGRLDLTAFSEAAPSVLLEALSAWPRSSAARWSACSASKAC